MKNIISYFSVVQTKFRHWSWTLGKAPTLLFLVGYLGIIFGFSLVFFYVLSDSDFYHSTSQYEYEFFNKDADSILYNIRSGLINNFLESHKEIYEINGWKININDLGITSLYLGNYPEEFSFKLSLPITHETNEKTDIWSQITASMTARLDNKIRIDNLIYMFCSLEEHMLEENMYAPIKGIPTYKDLFLTDFYAVDENVFLLPLSVDLYDSIVGFGQGYKGFPAKVSGQYWRMLYFSTGVATSSAFGDIVPVSTWARFTVTLESLFSIIFIGLFLNSLAYDISEVLEISQNSKMELKSKEKRKHTYTSRRP
jgi:hypothetical protein